jgi:hypothetical protein
VKQKNEAISKCYKHILWLINFEWKERKDVGERQRKNVQEVDGKTNRYILVRV